MNIFYFKMLLFTFLIKTLVLPHNENYINNHYNINLIPKNIQGTTIKSRLLAQSQNHNPHYHNDPELKEIIDKLNDEAIKKYQQTHEPYKQLQELVEKNRTKLSGGNGAEPMSGIEKDLLETYEEIFGHKNDIMLKSGMYPNDDDTSDKSSSCECTNTDNTDLTKRKGKDKYLKHLKHRCTRGICFCSVGSALLTILGLAAAKKAAVDAIPLSVYEAAIQNCVSTSSLFHIFNGGSLTTALQAGTTTCAAVAVDDIVTPAVGAATATIFPYSIAIYVLIAITVILIVLYIWLYRRRKNSLKHECKKHLCK
ncbi:stevor PIR protein, putative [Plasmodium reichenowi]|uniref:Stevor PIR protein, putative n=1 Tax=Plasmodium reichenowi TaxID=5854 RepID=A0A2P9DSW2_PLARE|nr:stevor PIR protein, putative [Plasmodium reichenowi]